MARMQSFQQAPETHVRAATDGEPPHSSPKPSHAKNRGRLDVMADVLDCCRSASSKSHIMLFANVNSIAATRMIEALSETGLIDSVRDDEGVVYLATSKGASFLAKYLELQRFVSPELVPAESKMNNPNRLNSLNF